MPLKKGSTSNPKPQPPPPKNAAELSKETEDFIMSVLRGRQEGAIMSREKGFDSADKSAAPNMKQLGKIWDELLRLGFSKEDAETGVREAPSESLSSILDWLCLNLDETR